MYLNCSYVPDSIGRIILENFLFFFSSAEFDCCCFYLHSAHSSIHIRILSLYTAYRANTVCACMCVCACMLCLLWLETHWQSFPQTHNLMLHTASDSIRFHPNSRFSGIGHRPFFARRNCDFTMKDDEFKRRLQRYGRFKISFVMSSHRHSFQFSRIAQFSASKYMQFRNVLELTHTLSKWHRHRHRHSRISLAKANSNDVTKSSLLSCQSL